MTRQVLCEWLSRYRFSWVELLGISATSALFLNGYWALSFALVIGFSVVQALLESRAS